MTPCQSKQNKDCAGNARDHIHSWRVVQILQSVASEALGSWRVCRGGRMCAVYFGKRMQAQWVYLISSLCLLGNPTAKNRANSGRAERLTRLHVTGRCKVLRTGNSKARGDTQRPLAREFGVLSTAGTCWRKNGTSVSSMACGEASLQEAILNHTATWCRSRLPQNQGTANGRGFDWDGGASDAARSKRTLAEQPGQRGKYRQQHRRRGRPCRGRRPS